MKKTCINSIAIIGLGLIGASVLRALKKSPLAEEQHIIFKGYDPSFTEKDVRHIEQLGLDHFQPDKKTLYDADLIILAAPVETNIVLLDEIRDLAPKHALVSDVSSTKAAIANRAAELNLAFIGMHPIAGREQQGYHASHDGLLAGKTVVICADRHTISRPDAANVMALLESIKCRIALMTPEEHDRIVATVSHLPQMLSTALVNYCESDIDKSGPGFLTLTRLAGSSWEIWRDIVSTNRENIATELEQFSRELEQLADNVRNNRADKIRERFEHANLLYEKLKENCNS
ncbi:MAG: prephenate dehydrogenase [Chlorobium sp.]|nr:prephenate dehydrogenase [Chlorobium sp.]MCW8815928.1 prephenate dehydrogenase [Chlorobium sp.]MCW8820481.1 prephenate dehydrogenase [Ignavibacteriaceae bacterium]